MSTDFPSDENIKEAPHNSSCDALRKLCGIALIGNKSGTDEDVVNPRRSA